MGISTHDASQCLHLRRNRSITSLGSKDPSPIRWPLPVARLAHWLQLVWPVGRYSTLGRKANEDFSCLLQSARPGATLVHVRTNAGALALARSGAPLPEARGARGLPPRRH